MRNLVLFVAFLAVFGAAAAQSKDPDKNDPCKAMPDAKASEAKHFLTFEQFDKELREALSKQDVVALSFLVKWPLRVNDGGGTFSIDDATALKSQFQEIFIPAVRKEILSDPMDEPGCGPFGVGYARGVIWVNASDRGYAIEAVNRDAVPPYQGKWKLPRVIYVCQTERHRVVVDTALGGAFRYRAWNKPHPVTGKPDLEIVDGKGSFEGSNVCAIPVWTFKSGTATYTVNGSVGCWGEVEPPKEATGQLKVEVGDKPSVEDWCF